MPPISGADLLALGGAGDPPAALCRIEILSKRLTLACQGVRVIDPMTAGVAVEAPTIMDVCRSAAITLPARPEIAGRDWFQKPLHQLFLFTHR